MKHFLVTLIIFLLVSCAGHQCEYEKTEWRDYKLLGLDEPKHFYIDVQDILTGKIYKHVYVSKHCNEWRKLRIGETYKLKRVYWTDGGHENANFDGLYDCLCK